eukprot:scaffold6846_cov107-Cylindrotheca_fusiformis.AAC.7
MERNEANNKEALPRSIPTRKEKHEEEGTRSENSFSRRRSHHDPCWQHEPRVPIDLFVPVQRAGGENYDHAKNIDDGSGASSSESELSSSSSSSFRHDYDEDDRSGMSRRIDHLNSRRIEYLTSAQGDLQAANRRLREENNILRKIIDSIQESINNGDR